MRRGARGFTLVETLVVVAIIMILAAIIYPVYETVTKRAETASCSSNLHNLGMAIGLYADDYDGMFVPARTSYGAPAVYGTSWDVLLLPYHRVEELYLCPSDQSATWASGTTCFKHSYGLNLDLTMVGGYNGSSLMQGDVQSPGQTILLFEILGSARALGSSYNANKLSRLDTRHNTGCNFGFADGHCKWLRPRQTAEGAVNMWYP